MLNFIPIRRTPYYIVLAIYITIMFSLGVVINVPGTPRILSFVFIAVNGALAFVFANKKLDIPIMLGLFLTVIADYHLILTGDFYQGLIWFSLVQIAYALYTILIARNRLEVIINILTRIVLSAIVILVFFLILKDNMDLTVGLVGFYFTNLILTFAFSIVHVKKNYVLALGMLLYILCDVFVGLDFVGANNLLGNGVILESAGQIVWYFYPFGQMLILLSMFFPRMVVSKKNH